MPNVDITPGLHTHETNRFPRTADLRRSRQIEHDQDFRIVCAVPHFGPQSGAATSRTMPTTNWPESLQATRRQFMQKTGCKACYWSKISSKIADNIWGTANHAVAKCCKGLSVVLSKVAAASDGRVLLGQRWAARGQHLIRRGLRISRLGELLSSYNDRRLPRRGFPLWLVVFRGNHGGGQRCHFCFYTSAGTLGIGKSSGEAATHESTPRTTTGDGISNNSAATRGVQALQRT